MKKATAKFEEIIKEAQKLKSDFEDYQEEEGGGSGSNDDDDFGGDDDNLDDFFASLGISRPK